MKHVDMAVFRAAVINKIDPRGLTVRFAPVAEPLVASQTERVATFVFSDNSVDRYGDTIDARGWMLDDYQANPIALFGHDSESVQNVIGRSRNVRIQGNQLIGEIEFMAAAVNPTAEAVYQMVKGGYLNTVSVGFQPLEWALTKDKTRPGGVDFRKQALLEISIVPVPANPNAVVQARAAGIDVDRLKLIEGAAPSAKISTRGLYEVSFLAQLLAELAYLEDMVEWEAEIEGDGSAIPQRLTDAMQALGQVLVDMTVEEVAELVSAEDDAATVPVLVDDPAVMAGLSQGQRTLVAFIRLARLGAAASLTFSTQKFTAADMARLFAAPSPIVRAGKVLSAANQKALSEAHGHVTKGCDIMKGVLDSACDDPEDPECDDNEDKALGRAKRRRIAEALKLQTGL